MSRPPTESRSVRVLVVEDDEDMQKVLCEIVERLGHTVTATDKAKETLLAIERGDAELILLDLKMPAVSGIDILKVVRRRQFPVPVIVVSGFISQDLAGQLARIGVQGMVAKPFKKDRLEAEIKRVCEHFLGV